MPRESSNGRRRRERYNRINREYLAAHKGEPCPVALAIKSERMEINQTHHIRGRGGDLLFDVRYFLPVSQFGQDWIHSHPAEARERGWLVVNHAREINFVK